MEHATQVQQARKLLHYLDTRSTSMAEGLYRNPVSDYTCERQAAAERRVFFREHPLLIGLSCEMPEPGDFVTDDFSGVPILVVRGESGAVNAFMNVCRHRGARVAQGRGEGMKVFSCPYHAWTYDREGRLVSIPAPEGFDALDRDQHGLCRLPVVEQYGMIWVRPTPGPAFAIDDYLDGTAADLAAYALDGYHHYETRVLQPRMNWKLVVDTFLETYHLKVLHKTTVAPILHNNTGTFDGFGRNLRVIAARKTFDALRGTPEREWDLIAHAAVVYVLFPNTVFIMQGDHLETWRVYPAGNGVDEARMHVSLYTPEPPTTDKARRHWDRNMDLLLATVEREDFPLAENIQRGFHTGAQDCITYGRNEPALAHYHRSIKAALGIAEHSPA